MENLISVIIPIYNVGEYLDECISSVCNQKYKKLEIILVNDGSTDNSLEICKQYKEKDGRIVVIDKKNEGLLAARKTGVDVATSEYISFLDGDDYIEDDLYERVSEIINDYHPDIISYGLTVCRGDDRVEVPDLIKSGYYKRDEMKNEIFPVMMLNGKTKQNAINAGIVLKIVKRSIIEEILCRVDTSISVAEDASLTYPCVFLANSMYCDSNNVGYRYRILEDSMSHRFSRRWYENVVKFEAWMNNFFENCDDQCIHNNINSEIFYLFFRGLNSEIEKTIINGEDYRQVYSYNEKLRYYMDKLDNNNYVFSISERIKIFLLRTHMLGIYSFVKKIKRYI